MGYWGSCSWHGDWENVTNWCPACWASNETKPDRAARIRALAERMILADLSAPDRPYWGTDKVWMQASMRVDELDRLEAAEREKGKGRP